MTKRNIQFMCLTAVGLILAGCGSNDAELKQYAQQRKMSEVQTAAFMACAGDLRRNKPVIASAEGKLVMKSVPHDICACQSKTMTAVFVENDYKGFASFAEYLAKEEKKRPPRFSKKQLKEGLKSPEAAKRLETAFNSCVAVYRGNNKDKLADLFELLPPKEPEKKDEKAKTPS
jgi:hypothetical protein